MNDDLARWLHMRALDVAASVALTLLLLSLVGCGGGGSAGPLPPPAVPQARGPLVVGYFGSSPAQLEQTYRHVNVHWAMGWFEDRALTIAAAKQRGLKVVLYLPEAYVSADRVRALFTILRAQGLLDQVAYLYPADEPDRFHNAPTINAANGIARAVATEFGIAPRIAVIYAGSDSFPGVESADVVGLDDYDKGAGVLGADYDSLRAALRPGQRLMLVPGGASPWRHDPRPWFAYAAAHPDVEMVTPFIWFDSWDGTSNAGIQSNGMAPAYCAAAIPFTGGTC